VNQRRPASALAGSGAASPAVSAPKGYGAVGGLIIALAFGVGLYLRLAQLDARPMHHDEANQAVKFGTLLEQGHYAYDTFDHHGPTLYYLTLPVAWLRGQATLASTDEWTLRSLPVAFGAATILLVALMPARLGRVTAAAAAVLMAVSPAMVFYSRMYIQEALFTGFTLAFAIALGRVVTEGGARWPLVAGLAAGLAVATKETAILMLPAAVLTCGLAWWSLGPGRRPAPLAGGWRRAAVIALGTGAVVAAGFYTSFFTNPGALLGPLRAAPAYFERGVDPSNHVQPWHWYLHILAWWSAEGVTWSEGLILGLATVGALAAWLRPDRSEPGAAFWPRYLTANAVLTLAVFSVIPYKTPWNVMPFHAAIVVAAGVGAAAIVRANASRVVHAALAAGLALGAGHLAWEAWRASIVYAADPRNPYVYSQTVPDAVRMASRIRDLAALHADRERMLVQVIAGPGEQWPLPWYLRAMPHVGYWPDLKGVPGLDAPVIVGSMGNTEALDAALGDRYVSEFFGTRPGVLLTLYVERGLWESFLARAALGGD
jgi:uncharacterized protein (TIGR03663 family)